MLWVKVFLLGEGENTKGLQQDRPGFMNSPGCGLWWVFMAALCRAVLLGIALCRALGADCWKCFQISFSSALKAIWRNSTEGGGAEKKTKHTHKQQHCSSWTLATACERTLLLFLFVCFFLALALLLVLCSESRTQLLPVFFSCFALLGFVDATGT